MRAVICGRPYVGWVGFRPFVVYLPV